MQLASKYRAALTLHGHLSRTLVADLLKSTAFQRQLFGVHECGHMLARARACWDTNAGAMMAVRPSRSMPCGPTKLPCLVTPITVCRKRHACLHHAWSRWPVAVEGAGGSAGCLLTTMHDALGAAAARRTA